MKNVRDSVLNPLNLIQCIHASQSGNPNICSLKEMLASTTSVQYSEQVFHNLKQPRNRRGSKSADDLLRSASIDQNPIVSVKVVVLNDVKAYRATSRKALIRWRDEMQQKNMQWSILCVVRGINRSSFEANEMSGHVKSNMDIKTLIKIMGKDEKSESANTFRLLMGDFGSNGDAPRLMTLILDESDRHIRFQYSAFEKLIGAVLDDRLHQRQRSMLDFPCPSYTAMMNNISTTKKAWQLHVLAVENYCFMLERIGLYEAALLHYEELDKTNEARYAQDDGGRGTMCFYNGDMLLKLSEGSMRNRALLMLYSGTMSDIDMRQFLFSRRFALLRKYDENMISLASSKTPISRRGSRISAEILHRSCCMSTTFLNHMDPHLMELAKASKISEIQLQTYQYLSRVLITRALHDHMQRYHSFLDLGDKALQEHLTLDRGDRKLLQTQINHIATAACMIMERAKITLIVLGINVHGSHSLLLPRRFQIDIKKMDAIKAELGENDETVCPVFCSNSFFWVPQRVGEYCKLANGAIGPDNAKKKIGISEKIDMMVENSGSSDYQTVKRILCKYKHFLFYSFSDAYWCNSFSRYLLGRLARSFLI